MADPKDWFTAGLEHIWLPYAQMRTLPAPVAIARTEGSRLYLADGRELVDGVGSWWTSIHGYNRPELLDAARDQMAKMPHIMLGGLAHEPAYRLATRLAEITPGDLSRVFFTESGSVAVEVAMKIAIQYFRNTAGVTRTKFVSFLGGYHGDTLATMSVCDPDEGMHHMFRGALAEQYVVALPETRDQIRALETLLSTDKKIAAVMIEPLIQGAGGMRMHSPQVLKTLRRLCDQAGVLLIFDEIFTGFGRTGEMFAAARAGVTPDIMCLGKAITGGITPLAATLASSKVYAAFHSENPDHALMHGPTYTGHALACAVANAGLDLFADGSLIKRVKKLEASLTSALAPAKDMDSVVDVRVLGAVAAVELADPFPIEAARKWFIDEGTFIRPLGRTVYLSPAYGISDDDLARLTGAILKFAKTGISDIG
ncbi:adenosylmethionine-8-amino-7-oxononanoate transaminase [Hyphomonas neptunium ATCC 15444]|uniref:Adenosylmethionine-8-amino-7-oxononanoate aminotransferase n=2 Tax=Hyphomonas TaxID=85 RepID=Q0C2S8_HYPNA|nr:MULTISPECIES: adenosylmethionine--8-amino-7-oxononanoate transaminase [Hyphomonas]ABI78718.1 adenosylmethionine-8-amino-7-oxononanoate transaminase [Hyphomonas neptunium ATCC 15444]KCZ95799.1 adenosylmethionine--8-amino-7-oxononanoate transaminase [Hyphomonas hirschiana VP5]